jgi:hypothetical protein
LLPSELTALDAARLVAICLGRGGATSHVAILAAAMDVPMLVGLGTGIHAVADGAMVIVDADARTLHVAPDTSALDAAHAAVATRRKNPGSDSRLDARLRRTLGVLDGTRIEVFANGAAPRMPAAVANGAEGCGLLRTELLFIDRDTAPDEREQRDAYQAISSSRRKTAGPQAHGRRRRQTAEISASAARRESGARSSREFAPRSLVRTAADAAARGLRVEPWRRAAAHTDGYGRHRIIAVRTVVEELNAELGNGPDQTRRHDRDSGCRAQ